MKGIGIENFRVFEEPTYFEFPGITALIGPNSSGKSSLLKLLKLLKSNNENEDKLPKVLNFRKSDHFLGNFDYSINTNQKEKGEKEIVISIPVVRLYDKNSKKESPLYTANYHFIKDINNNLKNGLLNKISIKNENEVLFSLSLKLDRNNFNSKKSDVIPVFNTEALINIIHDRLDYDIINQVRSTPTIDITLPEWINNYGIEKLKNVGFIDVITKDEFNEKNVSSGFSYLGAEIDYFSDAQINTYGNVSKIFTSDKIKVKEILTNVDENWNLSAKYKAELNKLIWPKNINWVAQLERLTEFKLTVFSYPVFSIILNHFDSWNILKEDEEDLEWIKEKLEETIPDNDTIELYIEEYEEHIRSINNLNDLITYFRQKDSLVLDIFFDRVAEIYQIGYNNWLINAADIYGCDENEFIEAVNESIVNNKSLKYDLNYFIEDLTNALENPLKPEGCLTNKYRGIDSLGISEKNILSSLYNLKNSYAKKLLNRDLDFLNDTIFKPLLDSFNNFNTISFDYLNSVRGSSDRVYSDQDQSTEWRRMIFKLSKLNETSKEVQFINDWIQKFEIGRKLHISRGLEAASSRVIIEYENGSAENLSDLGFGISQLLPIIVKLALSEKDSFIIIEEPEANLHPAFQSKLADLFVDANGKFEHKFLLETHSEYLIRKLQVLVAQEKIDSDKTVVYYFNPQSEKAEDEKGVKEIRIRKDGSLSDQFGSGFFDETANNRIELLRINNEQQN